MQTSSCIRGTIRSLPVSRATSIFVADGPVLYVQSGPSRPRSVRRIMDTFQALCLGRLEVYCWTEDCLRIRIDSVIVATPRLLGCRSLWLELVLRSRNCSFDIPVLATHSQNKQADPTA